MATHSEQIKFSCDQNDSKDFNDFKLFKEVVASHRNFKPKTRIRKNINMNTIINLMLRENLDLRHSKSKLIKFISILSLS